MRGRLNRTTEAESLTVATAATVLPSPPTQWATVPVGWSPTYLQNVDYNLGVMPGFDLAIWADSAVTLTGCRLLGALAHPTTFSPQDAVSVNDGQDSMLFTAHGFLSGDGPVNLTSTLTLPTGLAVNTNYWLVRVDADNVRFAESVYKALTGEFLTFSGSGSGTITLSETADSNKITWHNYGKIDPGDSVVLTAREGFIVRCNHHPTVLAYGLKGTLGAALPVNVSIYPVEAR